MVVASSVIYVIHVLLTFAIVATTNRHEEVTVQGQELNKFDDSPEHGCSDNFSMVAINLRFSWLGCFFVCFRHVFFGSSYKLAPTIATIVCNFVQFFMLSTDPSGWKIHFDQRLAMG